MNNYIAFETNKIVFKSDRATTNYRTNQIVASIFLLMDLSIGFANSFNYWCWILLEFKLSVPLDQVAKGLDKLCDVETGFIFS